MSPSESNQSQPPDIRLRFETNPDFASTIQTPEDVERVALEFLDETPEGQELMHRIGEARRRGSEDEQAIRERARYWRKLVIEISLITGIETEAAEHKRQREVYRNNILQVLSSINPLATTDEEIMTSLGMIREVPGARGHIFTFPDKILPPYVKEQWESYIGMIEQFEDAQQKLKSGIITQNDFNAIDMLRKKAHDTVATSIGEILEFEGWSLEDYRKLVAKMVDEKFAEPKGEMAVYAQFWRDRVINPEHLTGLHRKLGETSV